VVHLEVADGKHVATPRRQDDGRVPHDEWLIKPLTVHLATVQDESIASAVAVTTSVPADAVPAMPTASYAESYRRAARAIAIAAIMPSRTFD
jgi:hypothetical protein